MAQLNFPTTGLTTGTEYTSDNGVVYTYDGTKWIGHSPNISTGTNNSIINNGNTVQVDPSGNLIIPNGATIIYESGNPVTRWNATPAVAGCPIYVELTPDHFNAYTQNSHLSFNNDGTWHIGSNYNANGLFSNDNTATLYSNRGDVIIRTADASNYWTFGTDGNLTIPAAGDILRNGQSVLGGGSSSLVNGSATLTLNSDGSVSVPLASVIKAATDSYTGIATHNMNTFAYVNADGFFVDTLYNTAEYEWHFNNTGGLTLPSSIFPITFSAVLLPIYGGAPDIGPYGGDAWTLSVTFTEDANGVVSTSVAQIFPISNNPGYKTGDTYTFTETAHGIAGYTLTIVLDNVQYPGPAGWTANVECSQAPASPSTVSSNHAIKINSNNNIWAFGTDGVLTIPGDITLSTENGLVAPEGGYSQLADYDINNFVGADAGTVTIGTNYNNSANLWIFDTDGYLTLPLATKINSGGIGTTNAVEFGTVVATNPFPPNQGVANIANSEIYMSGGSAEARIITDAATGSLIYTGVEHVEVPAFAGMVAVDPDVTSQYSIDVDINGRIVIGATQEGGTLTTTNYTVGLGVLSYDYTINGILANPYGTFLTGAAGISMTTERGQVLFGGQPEECAPGLVSHFHIMKGNNYTVSTDLFFGDDYNYVKLPGADYIGSPDNPYNPLDDNRNFGVEIATVDLAAVDFQQYLWRFDTKGGLEFPDNSVQTTAWDYRNLENIDMDGGAASAVYTVNVRFAEGGTAGTRFSKTDPNYNGASAYGAEPEFTLDGGRA